MGRHCTAALALLYLLSVLVVAFCTGQEMCETGVSSKKRKAHQETLSELVARLQRDFCAQAAGTPG